MKYFSPRSHANRAVPDAVDLAFYRIARNVVIWLN